MGLKQGIIALGFICIGVFAWAQEGGSPATSIDLTEFHRLFPGEQLNAGFGLARDMISHVYLDRPFAPRDFDFAVVRSGWTKEQAIERLSQYGQVVRTLDMVKEVTQPSGRVFAYHYGFVVIIESQNTQMDFKFFKSYEEAHFRGLFNVEKVLFPMRGQSLSQMIDNLRDLHSRGQIPGPEMMSDPHRGFEGILNNEVRTVNWAMAQAKPLDWVIRGAMIFAKLGIPDFPAEEKEIMREYVRNVQYIMPRERGLFPRMYNHPRWWEVRRLLAGVGFFEHFDGWRWNQPVRVFVDRIQAEQVDRPFCSRLFAR